jgi:hypothetical protein
VCGCMEIVCLQEVTWNPIFHVAAFHKLIYFISYYYWLLVIVACTIFFSHASKTNQICPMKLLNEISGSFVNIFI